MRTASEIQKEYDDLKGKGKPDPKTDQVYQEAIRRAKLEEQAKDKRDFEAAVDRVMHGNEPEQQGAVPFVP
jgi:hypothetical protein